MAFVRLRTKIIYTAAANNELSNYVRHVVVTFTFAMCYRPSVCLSSVTFVRPTQAVQIFGNLYGIRYLGYPLTSTEKFHGDRPRGTPPPWELNTRGVAKYSDFEPIDGYTSKTVQDRR